MDGLTDLVIAAARPVLALRRQHQQRGTLAVREKSDFSPVTEADEASQAVLLRGLEGLLPGVPVISEEQQAMRIPAAPPAFVLIDPLDGTREFIAGRDEFTINVAIIAAGSPVAGVIGLPVHGQVFRGVVGRGAERLWTGGSSGEIISVHARSWRAPDPVALVSRSHLDGKSAALLDRLGVTQRLPCGSAIKFCRLAEGNADLYPRLAPTSAWDVAAGQAVLTAAGGAVVAPDGAPLRYGADVADFRIPAFIACGDPAQLGRIL